MKGRSFLFVVVLIAFFAISAPVPQARLLAQDTPTIALTIPFAGAPFYWAAAHGFKDEGERLGYNVVVNNAENSIERQVGHIDNYRVTNVVGAAAIALDADALVPAIEAYMADGHPFFAIDRDIRGPVTALLVTDNVVAGKSLGQYVRDRIDGPIHALVLYGPVSVVPFVDRLNGFLSAFQDDDSFTLVGTPDAEVDPNTALSIVTTYLQSNPEINVIYSVTDLTNSGAIAAVTEAGRMVPASDPAHIWIIGVDGNGETLQQIREGTTDASFSQYPYMQGVWTARAIDYALQGMGDTIPSGLFFGGDVVTPDNIASFPTLWGDIEFSQDIAQ
ncbi:MAG: sugar ABC transporter substrate-binding protein [Anaerolineae bacterium]|nr:sugar ABC transporter substrate-binding protein [Anaerolineae bacterium]